MTMRMPALLALLLTATVIAASASAEDRAISLTPSAPGASLFPLKNPGIVTLGTLSIENRIDFAISASSTSNGNLTYVWNWADGTPNGSGAFPNHTYIVAGIYNVVVTTTEKSSAGATLSTRSDTIVTTVTDAVKSNKLQTNENFGGSSQDSIRFSGTLHIPSSIPVSGQTVQISLGNLNLPFNPGSLGSNDGVVFSFTLNSKGIGTFTTNANVTFVATSSNGNAAGVTGASTLSSASCVGLFKIAQRVRSGGTAFVDAPFLLTVKKASFAATLANEGVLNKNANRENVRITSRILAYGIVYQSGINSLFTAKQGKKGRTR